MIGAVSAASDTSTEDIVKSDVTNNDISHSNANIVDVAKTNNNANTNTKDTSVGTDVLKKTEKLKNQNTNQSNDQKTSTTNDNKLKNSNANKDLLKETTTTVNDWDELNTTITNMQEDEITIQLTDNEYNAKDTITINKKVTIDGNGNTINGQKQHQIFTVNGELILKNLNIINGKSNYGGAIYNNGKLTIINCTFNNNNANDEGGAIYATISSTVNINNTTFTQNTANDVGGAISAEDYSTVNINNTTFTQNIATLGRGGAIYAYRDSTVNINNTTFTQNIATIDGGAICNHGTVIIMGSELTVNTADGYGAIYNQGGTLTLVDSNLQNDGLYIDSSVGDGVVPIGGYITFVTTQVFDISVLPAVDVDLVEIQLSNGDGYTGEVWVNVTNSTFNQIVKVNLKNGEGSGTINLPIGNKYKATINTIQGLSFNPQTQEFTTIHETSFTALYSNITNSQDDTLTLTHDYIYDNRTDTNLKTGIPINKTITINGNEHTIDGSNEARIFNITNTGNLTLTNITITRGQITLDGYENDGYGGAIYNKGNLTIIHSTITDNNIYSTTDNGMTYVGLGGAIANLNGAILTINNSNISNNKIWGNKIYAGKGGAIYAEDSQVYINNTIFTKNIAKDESSCLGGGAIYAWGSMSKVVITGSLFVDNYADTFGGAIYGYDFKNLTVNNNIFLNNTGTNIIYLWKGNSEFKYDLEFNWFGNNATNYKGLNKEDIVGTYSVDELKLDSWLFLKATNTTDTVNVFNTSNITFKLDLYNSTTTADDKVFDYDNTQLYPINLNITSSKGTVDKKTAQLNDTIVYNATSGGKGSVTASIASASCTIELTNNEIPTEIRVNNNTLDLKVDDIFTLIPTTTPEDLDVTFVQDDSGVYIVDENGVVTALKNGTGSILVKVGGDGVYAENSTTVTVNVKKIPTKITLNNDKITLNVTDTINCGASLNPKGAGSLTYKSSNASVAKVDNNGKITALSQGTATITISFKGNAKYAAATDETIQITVKLKNTTLNIDKTTINQAVDDKYHIIATSTPEGLPITFTTNDTNLILLSMDGNITALDVGTAYINVSVGGDGVYEYTQTQVTVNIAKKEFKTLITELHIDEILFSGKNATITGYLIANGTGLSKQEIILRLSNVTDYEEHYATTDDEGKFNITVQPYVLGNVNLTAIYKGNTTNKYIYNKTSTTTITKIDKIYYNITFDLIQTSYDYNATITITGNVTSNYQPLDVDYVNVTLNNGAQESVKLNGGKFTYTFNGTIGGLNNITVTCKDATNSTHTFIKYPTTFTISNIPDFTEGSSINLTVTELNNYTGPVIIIIGTEIYNLDMVNGIGNLTITPKLSPGTYTATIKFNGDANYTEANATSNNFTINAKPVPPSPTPTPSPDPVSKQNTKILAKNKVYKPAKYRNYTVTVKNSKGKPVKNTKVKLKIGKKTYTAKTNKKGIATFKIPNKKSKKKSTKKSYKITATLNKNAKKDKLTLKMGSKKYNTQTNNNGKGTFKIKTTKKIRKYTITLKTTTGQIVQKQKITLKVKGKTFKATTNNKGKATFKINNLNKNGKYKTKIQYKGNNQYNKSNKNVKITIKE